MFKEMKKFTFEQQSEFNDREARMLKNNLLIDEITNDLYCYYCERYSNPKQSGAVNRLKKENKLLIKLNELLRRTSLTKDQ